MFSNFLGLIEPHPLTRGTVSALYLRLQVQYYGSNYALKHEIEGVPAQIDDLRV